MPGLRWKKGGEELCSDTPLLHLILDLGNLVSVNHSLSFHFVPWTIGLRGNVVGRKGKGGEGERESERERESPSEYFCPFQSLLGDIIPLFLEQLFSTLVAH